LKRDGLPSSHLLQFYKTVIRHTQEYASLLWHPALTKSQAESLEAIQHIGLSNCQYHFFVISRLPLVLLCWQSLAFHPSKQNAWIIPNVFAKYLPIR